jgi:hypothetical protein
VSCIGLTVSKQSFRRTSKFNTDENLTMAREGWEIPRRHTFRLPLSETHIRGDEIGPRLISALRDLISTTSRMPPKSLF